MKQKIKSRIDKLLVERGLVESRTKAQALVMAGRVLVDGQVINKAGAEVKNAALISITEGLPLR